MLTVLSPAIDPVVWLGRAGLKDCAPFAPPAAGSTPPLIGRWARQGRRLRLCQPAILHVSSTFVPNPAEMQPRSELGVAVTTGKRLRPAGELANALRVSAASKIGSFIGSKPHSVAAR
jgi:hypothetical protein